MNSAISEFLYQSPYTRFMLLLVFCLKLHWFLNVSLPSHSLMEILYSFSQLESKLLLNKCLRNSYWIYSSWIPKLNSIYSESFKHVSWIEAKYNLIQQREKVTWVIKQLKKSNSTIIDSGKNKCLPQIPNIWINSALKLHAFS